MVVVSGVYDREKGVRTEDGTEAVGNEHGIRPHLREGQIAQSQNGVCLPNEVVRAVEKPLVKQWQTSARRHSECDVAAVRNHLVG